MRWERIRFIRGKTSHQNGMQGMMPELLGVLPCCRAPGRFRSSDGKWHMPWPANAPSRFLGSLWRLPLVAWNQCRRNVVSPAPIVISISRSFSVGSFLQTFSLCLPLACLIPSADADVFMEIALVAIARRIRSFRACNIQIMMLLAPPFHAP